MAQGKLKVKSKKPDLSLKKKSSHRGNKVVKKGRKVLPSRKGAQLEMQKINKSIQTGINKKIEQELAQKAHHLEDGKNFRLVKNPDLGKKSKKK